MSYKKFKQNIVTMLSSKAYRIENDAKEESRSSFTELLRKIETSYTLCTIYDLLFSDSKKYTMVDDNDEGLNDDYEEKMSDDGEMSDDEEEVSKEIIEKWIMLLKERWERIKDTNIAYTEDNQNYANLICMEIASYLEHITKKSRFRCLMPTLREGTQSVINMYELEKKNNDEFMSKQLSISEYTISDDNQRLIHVEDALAFANGDGKLRHTSYLKDERPIYLTESEQNRVINRTSDTKTWFKHIIDVVNFSFDPDTYGGRLQTLIKDLIDGSVKKWGRAAENEAKGKAAYKGIDDFFCFLDTLNVSDKEWFLGLKATTNFNSETETLGNIIQRLIIDFDQYVDEKKVDYKTEEDLEKAKRKFYKEYHENVTYCLNTIQGAIYTIVERNKKELYERPMKEGAPIPIRQLGLLEDLRDEAGREYNNNLITVIIKTNAYQSKGDDRLSQRLLMASAFKETMEEICYEQFFHAAADGDIRSINYLLSIEWIDVNSRNKEEQTLLHVAAHKNQAHVMKTLLEEKADPNQFDRDGYTPLHCAVERESIDAAQQLLADTRVKYDTALRLAIYSNKQKIMPSFLKSENVKLSVSDCCEIFSNLLGHCNADLFTTFVEKVDDGVLMQWIYNYLKHEQVKLAKHHGYWEIFFRIKSREMVNMLIDRVSLLFEDIIDEEKRIKDELIAMRRSIEHAKEKKGEEKNHSSYQHGPVNPNSPNTNSPSFFQPANRDTQVQDSKNVESEEKKNLELYDF